MNELHTAAERLEARPSQEGVPYERYTTELWSQIDACLPGYGPAWYRELTLKYRLGGCGFRYPLDDRKYIGICIFPRPSVALLDVYTRKDFPLGSLREYGYFCFADAKCDNFWIFKNNGGTNPEVFYLESTCWDGGEPSENNGIIKTNLRLTELIDYGARWSRSLTGDEE